MRAYNHHASLCVACYRTVFFVLCVVIVAPSFLFAQEATSEDVAARRVRLEEELKKIEQEIASEQGNLDEKRRERTSLERDIAILDAEISKAKLNIRARDISIKKLSTDIGSKEEIIEELNTKLNRQKQSLAQILRRTQKISDYSLAEMALGNDSISDFFSDIDSFESIKISLQESFRKIEGIRVDTEEAKLVLEDRREEERGLRNLQELQKREIEEREREKQKILSTTKGQEAAYQKLLKEKERTAAQIRAELFGLRDSAAIPFGLALDYANEASKATGVRAALILGILTQETKLGEILGTGTWTVDMHPTRDRPIYPFIMQVLGLDPDKMPVSRAQRGGYGGAMGPAQFIPSTWVCYGGFINTQTNSCSDRKNLTRERFWAGPWHYDENKDRLRALTEKDSPSNPWDPRDAIMATAVLLADNGATAGTRSAERLAALRYYAGWTNATKSGNAFYGDSVMQHADYYQKQIDILSGS